MLKIRFSTKKFRHGIKHAEDLLMNNICERKKLQQDCQRGYQTMHIALHGPQNKDHTLEESSTGGELPGSSTTALLGDWPGAVLRIRWKTEAKPDKSFS